MKIFLPRKPVSYSNKIKWIWDYTHMSEKVIKEQPFAAVFQNRCSQYFAIFFKISQYSQENTYVGVYLIMLQEENPTQVFSYEYCEIF